MMLPSIPHEEVVKIVERLPEDQQKDPRLLFRQVVIIA
jgi:hypothetical protein